MHASYITSGPVFELALPPTVGFDDPHTRKTLALLRLVSLPFHGHIRCVKPLSQEGSEIFGQLYHLFSSLLFSCPFSHRLCFWFIACGIGSGVRSESSAGQGSRGRHSCKCTLRRHGAARHRCRSPLPCVRYFEIDRCRGRAKHCAERSP